MDPWRAGVEQFAPAIDKVGEQGLLVGEQKVMLSLNHAYPVKTYTH